jgi:formylglycine-generating enzyme required for sulfatase activity
MVDAARWLLGRIADARRNWLSRKSSVTLNLAPPVKPKTGEKPKSPGIDDYPGGKWKPPKISLVTPKKPTRDFSVFSSLEFCDIPSGLFSMGTDYDDGLGQEYEKPIHGVILSRPFRLAKYPVTQNLWEFCMGYNPSQFKGDSRPVENVTWKEVQIFISRLNATADRLYRLPTEAEWEYAARGGTAWPYYFGPTPEELPQFAWFGHNSGNRTQNVGLKDPNPWGLYDMLGNVWEWVSDWYGDYDSSTATNPKGPPEGSSKVIRGGAWGSTPWLCRVTTRSVKSPDERSPLIGFRLALDGSSASDETALEDKLPETFMDIAESTGVRIFDDSGCSIHRLNEEFEDFVDFDEDEDDEDYDDYDDYDEDDEDEPDD